MKLLVLFLIGWAGPALCCDGCEGSFYVFVAEEKKWDDARDYCYERGGRLADIDDIDEDRRAWGACRDGYDQDGRYPQDCWIGLESDDGYYGPWSWVNSDERYSYNNWFSVTEPNEKRGVRACARYRYQDDIKDNEPHWFDYRCDNKHAFVCEYDYEEVELYCPLEPTPAMKDKDVNVRGSIYLDLDPDYRSYAYPEDRKGRVTVDIDIQGNALEKNEYHGIHIHEGRELNHDGTGCEGHFNPRGEPHACLPFERRHVGDMGNIVSHDGYEIEESLKIDDIFDEVPNIVGRCIIFHERRDNCQNEYDISTTGDAGSRYSQCLIDVRPRKHYKLRELEEREGDYLVTGLASGGFVIAIAGVVLIVKRARRKKYEAVKTVRDVEIIAA